MILGIHLRGCARHWVWVAGLALLLRAGAAQSPGAAEFRRDIRPLLESYCFDCHADGANKGKVAFDTFESDQAAVQSRQLWWRVLRNLRAGIMPPAKKARPTHEQQERIADWIKTAVFQIHPDHPDPGRVRVRRLNRAEYRNTIRDLMGVDFDTQVEFPPDDTGYGFDTIGAVLTLPPMLLEKYLAAANKIVAEAVPIVPATVSEPGAQPKNYGRFFPREVPATPEGRRAYAGEVLRGFARRAFRRPVDEPTVARLVALAEEIYTQPDRTFEAGVAQAMMAVLASPRFLFREEQAQPSPEPGAFPFIDEYSLASRLSYFFWSSMPDEQLFHLAEKGRLRQNLSAQVAKMLKDPRSQAFIRNFTGQWLRARDIEHVPIEARAVLAREKKPDPAAQRNRNRFRELDGQSAESLTPAEQEELAELRAAFKARGRSSRADLSPELRHAMRLETEAVFDYVVREDRNLLELVDSDYTFLNERLAKHYGIPNVSGDQLRRVTLPPDSLRGGVLTEGTVLAVTSNPTRTSPVKRGLFILENFLGTPPPPPPPDIPPLEAAAKALGEQAPSLRETLAAHRADALCRSCHNRMDPLGLAFEHFNALGLWRDTEYGQAIDASGKLITGEEFAGVQELKRILVQNHARDFYRTLTEKVLTYALGRGLEDYDTETVDQIVARIEKSNGRPSALLAGVVESAPFQKCRPPSGLVAAVAGGQTIASSSNGPLK
ncbi:MAG: DUF1592 domain-containing protein [Verrucomicrobiota bacterium]|jgi:hypothetical protein